MTVVFALAGYQIGISPDERQWPPGLELLLPLALIAVLVGLVVYLMDRRRVGILAGPAFITVVVFFGVTACSAGFLVGAIPRIY